MQKCNKKSHSFYDLYKAKRDALHPSMQWLNEIAERCNVKPITVQRWVYRTTTPNKSARRIISDYLGIPEETLFPEINN